jgi:hypothetical protein
MHHLTQLGQLQQPLSRRHNRHHGNLDVSCERNAVHCSPRPCAAIACPLQLERRRQLGQGAGRASPVSDPKCAINFVSIEANPRPRQRRNAHCNGSGRRPPSKNGTTVRSLPGADSHRRGTGFAILLDKRQLKTPSKAPLLLPKSKRVLAALIAHEWDNQDKNLKSHTLPLVGTLARRLR